MVLTIILFSIKYLRGKNRKKKQLRDGQADSHN